MGDYINPPPPNTYWHGRSSSVDENIANYIEGWVGYDENYPNLNLPGYRGIMDIRCEKTTPFNFNNTSDRTLQNDNYVNLHAVEIESMCDCWVEQGIGPQFYKISKIAECARKDECGFCGGPEYYGNLLAYAMETADDFNYFDDVDDSRYCSLKHLITECPTPPHPKSNSKVGFEFPNSNSDNQCGDGFARYVSGGWSCACRVGYPCVELGNSCTPNDRVWDPYMGPAGGNWENSGGDMGKPIKGKLNGYYNLRKNDPRTISAGKSLWKGWKHNQCGDAGGYGHQYRDRPGRAGPSDGCLLPRRPGIRGRPCPPRHGQLRRRH